MTNDEFDIVLYDKERGYSAGLLVQALGENQFRMRENDPFTEGWDFGTEFEARKNTDGKYEIVKIIKKSPFITRRVFLSTRYNQSDYEFLGSELMKIGGFWQYNGGIVTFNIPVDKEQFINKMLADLGVLNMMLD
jgi:hypothetical protein